MGDDSGDEMENNTVLVLVHRFGKTTNYLNIPNQIIYVARLKISQNYDSGQNKYIFFAVLSHHLYLFISVIGCSAYFLINFYDSTGVLYLKGLQES